MYFSLKNFRASVLLLSFILACALTASAQSADNSSASFTKEKIYSRREVTKPAVIIDQPKVEYRKEAGMGDVDGVVVLSLVLSHTGQVTNVQVVEGLSSAQNNAAIRAAKQIKFMPAGLNGEPVSQSLTVEYPFSFMTFEGGSPTELRGVSKIYVDAGGDAEEQRNITGEVLKYLPKLTVVDTVDEAEVILAFNAFDRTETYNYVQKDIWSGEKKYASNIRFEIKVGQGLVLRRATKTRLRSLMEFKDPHWNKLERKPSTNFARAFVKAYKLANGIEDE